MTPLQRIYVDPGFVSRLLLGALSEHEQRLLAVRLLKSDAGFRLEVRSVVEPFSMFDLDLVAAYAEALRRTRDGEAVDLGITRARILATAFTRQPDLDAQMRAFTFSDVLQLGQVTRSLFSWSMAEHLLSRAGEPSRSAYQRRTGLYLALMVIDVVDILGAAGHSPHFPSVVADVRKRVRDAHRIQEN